MPKTKQQVDEVSNYLTVLEPYILLATSQHYISDKKDQVAKQLEEFYDKYKEKKSVRYILMNSATRDYLRTYYSYEVSYVPKDLEKKFAHPIQGIILGFGIVLYEKAENFVLIPAIDEKQTRSDNKKLRMKFLQ